MELCLTSAVRTTRRQRRLYGSVSAALEGLTKSVAVFAHPRPDAGRNVLPSAQRPERNYDNGVAVKRFKAGMGLLLLPAQPDYGRVDRTPHGPSPDAVERGRVQLKDQARAEERAGGRAGADQLKNASAKLRWPAGHLGPSTTKGCQAGREGAQLGGRRGSWGRCRPDGVPGWQRRRRGSRGGSGAALEQHDLRPITEQDK